MIGLVVLSGCSGGGKSTLLIELARRGFSIVPEPGLRVIDEERATGGQAFPWVDIAAFARRALDVALHDHAAAVSRPLPVFFDRSAIDAACALHHATGEPYPTALETHLRYHPQVFFLPPWPDIYAGSLDRQHSFADAKAEYGRLREIYPALGYDVVIVEPQSVEERANAVLGALGLTASG